MSAKIQPHEDYERIEEQRTSSERTFGLVMAVIFLIVASLPLVHGAIQDLHWWAVIVAAAFATAAIVWSPALRPLNALWLRVGHLLHILISPIVIGLVFFVVVVPTGLLLRVLGRDHLRLRRNPSSPSYWVTRQSIESGSGAMNNQF
jgi:hypothetical protein